MDIDNLEPGMLCHTPKGSGYVVEIDLHNEFVTLQREDDAIPFQVHVDEIKELDT